MGRNGKGYETGADPHQLTSMHVHCSINEVHHFISKCISKGGTNDQDERNAEKHLLTNSNCLMVTKNITPTLSSFEL